MTKKPEWKPAAHVQAAINTAAQPAMARAGSSNPPAVPTRRVPARERSELQRHEDTARNLHRIGGGRPAPHVQTAMSMAAQPKLEERSVAEPLDAIRPIVAARQVITAAPRAFHGAGSRGTSSVQRSADPNRDKQLVVSRPSRLSLATPEQQSGTGGSGNLVVNQDVLLRILVKFDEVQQKISLKSHFSGLLGTGAVTVRAWIGEGDLGHITMKFELGRTFYVDIRGNYTKPGMLKEFGMASAGTWKMPYRKPVFPDYTSQSEYTSKLWNRKPSSKQKEGRLRRYDMSSVVKGEVATKILVPLLRKYGYWQLEGGPDSQGRRQGASVYNALKEAEEQYKLDVCRSPSIPKNVEVIRCLSLLELLTVALNQKIKTSQLPKDPGELIKIFEDVLIGAKGLVSAHLERFT